MALTRDFKDTVLSRVQANPRFRDVLLKEGIETMLAGEVETGKSILRDCIAATVGLEQLGVEIDSSPKMLIRMFGPAGRPQAYSLITVISHVQHHARLTLHVVAHSH